MSFTYIRNCNGPRMDPCGTPHVILEGSEKQLLKFTLNNQFERHDLNQPIAPNIFISISWSIVSKPFGAQSVSCQLSSPYQNPSKFYHAKR